jgi:hypothetical protein
LETTEQVVQIETESGRDSIETESGRDSIISMQTSFAVMTSCDWQTRARLRLIMLEF